MKSYWGPVGLDKSQQSREHVFSEEVVVVEAGCGAGGSEAAGFGATSCRLVLRGREQVAIVVLEDYNRSR